MRHLAGALLLALLIVPGSARAAPDFREAWTCSSRSDADGVNVTVMRTLDRQGRQLRADAQWFMSKPDPGSLWLWGVTDVEGEGDPPVFGEILISAPNGQNNPEATSWRLLLHGSAQRPSRAAAAYAFSDAPAGATVTWSRLTAMSSHRSPAMLSLIDRSGKVIAARTVEQAWLDRLRNRLGRALAESRTMAALYEERCSRVTEWLRL